MPAGDTTVFTLQDESRDWNRSLEGFIIRIKLFFIFMKALFQTNFSCNHKHLGLKGDSDFFLSVKQINSPHHHSQGVAWRTPTSVAAWWSDCSTALPPAAHTHKNQVKI